MKGAGTGGNKNNRKGRIMLTKESRNQECRQRHRSAIDSRLMTRSARDPADCDQRRVPAKRERDEGRQEQWQSRMESKLRGKPQGKMRSAFHFHYAEIREGRNSCSPVTIIMPILLPSCPKTPHDSSSDRDMRVTHADGSSHTHSVRQ